MEFIGLFFILVIGFAVYHRVTAGRFDHIRMEEYIQRSGGTLLDKRWAPFGPGWFGAPKSRIYRIIYRDREGSIHRAHVKTTWFNVDLTNDHIIFDPESGSESKGISPAS